MIVVISPAKTLDFDTPAHVELHSEPDHLTQSRKLIKVLKQMAPQDIAALMGISDKLAELNAQRYQDWKTPFTTKNAKQAILAFQGDVYLGLDAGSMGKREFNFAQKQLRILSGLYGVLRPMDLIQPYRLEMGTKLPTPKASNLYEFWGERITQTLNADLERSKSDALINLASNEYFNSVNLESLNAEVITPVFKDYKNGQYKIISFYAKKARGMMAAYAIRNRITKPEQLKDFDTAGYHYSESESNKLKNKSKNWVFIRKEIG